MTEEFVEERGLVEGNSVEQTRDRTQSREALQHALERIRTVAKRNKKERFTALWHHVYNPDRLREAYFSLRKRASAGVDGETWATYGQNLDARIEFLSERLSKGSYCAKPVRRVMIPKSDGRKRPIGIPTLEDKIVQRATVEVLNAVYETDFLGFSYGFRPKRNQHRALDALWVGLI